MARAVDRPADHKTASSASGEGKSAFADIDAAQFERGRNDSKVRRFADLADRYFAALRRERRAPRS